MRTFVNETGTDVVHCYTVIAPSLLGDHPNEQQVNDGRALFMMIKIYRDGVLTPVIGQLRPGMLSLISVASCLVLLGGLKVLHNCHRAYIRIIETHSAFCRHSKTYLFTVSDRLNLTFIFFYQFFIFYWFYFFPVCFYVCKALLITG